MANRVALALVVTASMAAASCGGGEAPSQSQSQSATPAAPAVADASHTEHAGGGRVYFAKPKNGDMVKSPVQFEFASDMFQIAAVPAGEVTTARPGMGHYHLGVDTECLPVGEVIPKANPWIHFGTGSNMIEYPMPPGQHKVVLQAGDDQHRTLAGLCETMTITIVP